MYVMSETIIAPFRLQELTGSVQRLMSWQCAQAVRRQFVHRGGGGTRARRQGPAQTEGPGEAIPPAAETMHDTMHAIGPGHDLWQAGATFFCKRCACHGDVRAKGLLSACDADPAKLRFKATILNRLKSGCHPRTKDFLGVPVRALANKCP